MTKSLLLLLSFIFIQCISPNKVSEQEFYFDSAHLDDLSLDSLPSFWNGSSLRVGNCHSLYYVNYRGQIDASSCYTSEVSKLLGVAVFTNPTLAFEAAEARTKLDTTTHGGVEFKVFRRGDSTTGKTWWISDNGANRFCLITLKYNTVIEAIQNAPSLALAQDSLWSAISEIEHRIQLFANNSPPVIPRGKLFNSTSLTKLNISDLTEFWQGDSSNQMDDFNTPEYEGFLHSIAYAVYSTSFDIRKFISVSVYETTDQAILGIYSQRTWSQAPTCYGDPDGLVKGVWFYTCSPGSTPYVVITFQKWNTIVDISYYPQNYEIITNTVKEIARRVDELSK